MKYHYLQAPRRNYKGMSQTIIKAILSLMFIVIFWDLIFNYGKLTITLMFLTEGN